MSTKQEEKRSFDAQAQLEMQEVGRVGGKWPRVPRSGTEPPVWSPGLVLWTHPSPTASGTPSRWSVSTPAAAPGAQGSACYINCLVISCAFWTDRIAFRVPVTSRKCQYPLMECERTEVMRCSDEGCLHLRTLPRPGEVGHSHQFYFVIFLLAFNTS